MAFKDPGQIYLCRLEILLDTDHKELKSPWGLGQ